MKATNLFMGMLLTIVTLHAQTHSDTKMENILTQQISVLFAGADERNWSKVSSVMDKQVLLDYSSMSGNPATLLFPEQITQAWAAFLPGFDRTNHTLSNFKAQFKNDHATVHYTGKADHFLDGEVWTVEGEYETELVHKGDQWLINKHKFHFQKQNGSTELPGKAAEKMENAALTAQNRATVDKFFIALETQQFELLKEVFAENGKQFNPYAPAGFPKSFDGAEGIYKQYSGLTMNFGKMKFPRQIFATEDPNFFFVKFKGEIEIKAGGKYENDYLGTFKLENGKVIEYTEYFNQIVMGKAFGVELK